MEKQPSFERIIGGTDQQKEKVRQEAEKASLKSGEELFGEYLVESTKEEQESIEKAAAYANEVVRQYGVIRQFDPERIFLLESGGVEKFTKGEIRQGVCNSFNQSIGVERSDSNALLASSVVHEMFHMNSYHSAQVMEKKAWLLFKKIEDRPYRSGISMTGREGEGEYFGLAEEAIIAILSRRFFDEVITQDPLYKEEMERTRKIKEWLIDFAEKHIPEQEKKLKFIATIQDILIIPDSQKVYEMLYESNKEDDYKMGYFSGFFEENLKSGNIFHERSEERERFGKVLDRIIFESKEKIVDRNQLFDEFARAHFTGNYLPLARIIENVLGKGTFREIAEELGIMNNK